MQVRAVLGLAFDCERAPHLNGALVHAVQPHAGAGLYGVEPHAVVMNVEVEGVPRVGQFEFNLLGMGMFEEVVEGFAGDAVQAVFDFERQAINALGTEGSADTGAAFHSVEAGLQRGDEAFLVEDGGTQFKDHQAHFAEGLLGSIADFAKLLGGEVGLPGLDLTGSSFGLQVESIQGLGDRVMEVTREAVAFLNNGKFPGLGGIFLKLLVGGLEFDEQAFGFAAGVFGLQGKDREGGDEDQARGVEQGKGQGLRPAELENLSGEVEDEQKGNPYVGGTAGEEVGGLPGKGKVKDGEKVNLEKCKGTEKDDGGLEGEVEVNTPGNGAGEPGFQPKGDTVYDEREDDPLVDRGPRVDGNHCPPHTDGSPKHVTDADEKKFMGAVEGWLLHQLMSVKTSEVYCR